MGIKVRDPIFQYAQASKQHLSIINSVGLHDEDKKKPEFWVRGPLIPNSGYHRSERSQNEYSINSGEAKNVPPAQKNVTFILKIVPEE